MRLIPKLHTTETAIKLPPMLLWLLVITGIILAIFIIAFLVGGLNLDRAVGTISESISAS